MHAMNIRKRYVPHVEPGTPVTSKALSIEVGEVYECHLNALVTMQECAPPPLGGDSRMQRIAYACFEYAVNGVIKKSELANMDSDWLDLSAFISAGRVYAEHYGGTVPLIMEKILTMGAIRAALDEDTIGLDGLPVVLADSGTGFLSLKEIAILSQMNEKSVRNATHQTLEDRLETTKQGTRSVVSSSEALRWLKNRKSFIATKISD